MWIIKLKIKHDCTIGTRCEKFKCISYSLALSNWKQGKFDYTSQRHTIEGDETSVKNFLNELKKDKRIINLEIDKNTVFFIEKRFIETIPSSCYNPKMFYVKPVYVNKEGYEFWEMGSWDRNILKNYFKDLKKEKNMKVELLSFKDTRLNNIYFPSVMPELTEKHKRKAHVCLGNTIGNYADRSEIFGLFSKNSQKGDLLVLGFQLDTDIDILFEKYSTNQEFANLILNWERDPDYSQLQWGLDKENRIIKAMYEGLEVFRSKKYNPKKLRDFVSNSGYGLKSEVIDDDKNSCIQVYEKI